MLNAGFQFLEQRDAEDNITHAGVVSKKSPFATSDNAGIYDVIAEDLRVLYETLGSTNLASTVKRINDIYNEMLTNPDFGATSAALSAQQAIDAMNSANASATAAREDADSLSNAMAEVEADRDEVATNTATVQAAIETLREYNEACASNAAIASAKASAASTSAANAKTSEDNAKDSETNAAASEANALVSKNSATASANAAALSATQASDSENNASISATNASSSAELSRKWATGENSPDNANDIDSPTTKTQSSRSWALYAKSQAMSASTSAASASDSAASASDSATSANTSAVSASNSATSASASAASASDSADNAAANAAQVQSAVDDAVALILQAIQGGGEVKIRIDDVLYDIDHIVLDGVAYYPTILSIGNTADENATMWVKP